MIRVPQVRVVDDEGQQLGVMPTHEALRVAQERGFDLVEVAPLAAPPVARFLDYGQFKYEQARRDRDARRHQRSVEFKEIRLSPKIGTGDFDTKVRRAIQFLEAGDRIKVSCRFRGRELTHAYLGRDLLMKFADLVKDHGVVERQPLLEGKSMSIVITSTHKVKPLPTAEDGRAASAPAEAGQQAAPAAEAPAADAPPRISRPGSTGRQAGRTEATNHRVAGRAGRHSRPGSPAGRRAIVVPKMKTHKAAAKRIGITGGGKVVRGKAWRGHHLDIKSSRRTRRYEGKALLDPTAAKQVRRLLPYL